MKASRPTTLHYHHGGYKMLDYNTLNDKQLEAVQTTEGPLLVIAGAGSGKTRVLTYRIAHLISEKNVKPYNILAITFTNKAAKEMKERVENLLKNQYKCNYIMTFHGLCNHILKENFELFNFKKNI
jgi:DNA helicase-2/ATP-dependent DNA helicase PcrA